MSEFLIEYWLEVLFGVALSLLAMASKSINKKVKAEISKQEAIEQGIQALLRDRIVQAYYHYEDKGYITLHGLENVERMYAEYHNLGGNGTITKLVDDLHKLEVKDN